MKPLSGIQAVTLDVGGTLIEPWPSVGHVYSEIAARFGASGHAPALLNRQFGEAWRRKGHFDYSRRAWADLVQDTFRGLDQPVDWEGFFAALYADFILPHRWRLFPDVLPTLELLRGRGVRLAVLSNWDERLGPLLRHLELARHFEFIQASHELGHHKPDAALFSHVAARLRLDPVRILHVGDSRREDYEGARAAGFQALLVDRGSPEVFPDSIASLTDLDRFLV